MLWIKLRRLWFKWVLNIRTDPTDQFREDYETLIRLARRCAYDFAHAAEFTLKPGDDRYWLDISWEKRASWWTAMFAKGNPGKDYRIQYMMYLEDAERDRQTLFDILYENGLEEKVPRHIWDKVDINKIPF